MKVYRGVEVKIHMLYISALGWVARFVLHLEKEKAVTIVTISWIWADFTAGLNIQAVRKLIFFARNRILAVQLVTSHFTVPAVYSVDKVSLNERRNIPLVCNQASLGLGVSSNTKWKRTDLMGRRCELNYIVRWSLLSESSCRLLGCLKVLGGPEDGQHLKVCQMALRFRREEKRLEKDRTII
jgi:hypothetical protein